MRHQAFSPNTPPSKSPQIAHTLETFTVVVFTNLVKVAACGVCHTELDEIEGRTPPPKLPVVLGHQVVGRVEREARGGALKAGDRVGIGWIYSACGECRFCLSGDENLCADFTATGTFSPNDPSNHLVAQVMHSR